MSFEEKRERMNGYFISFFMLLILWLGSIISWGISASFLVMAPLANLIHRCIRMIPGPKSFLVLGFFLLTILILWLLHMVVTAYRQHHSLFHFINGLTFSQELPAKLKLAVDVSEITTPVEYTLDTTNLAFSYGLKSPRIVISQTIVQNLELDELIAILLHEESHCVHNDPLRIFLVRMAFSCVRQIKLIPKLVECLLLSTEITADHAAMLRLGDKSWYLASALLKIVQAEIPIPDSVAGATTVLENRINHLIDPTQKPVISILNIDYLSLATYLLLTFGTLFYSLQHLSVWFTCH